MRSYRSRLGPYLSITDIFTRGETHTGRRLPRDNRGSEWYDAAINQGMARVTGKHHKLEESGKDSPS